MLFGIFVEHFLRMKQISVLFLACMGLLSHTANAQSKGSYTVNGFVTDSQTGEKLISAYVFDQVSQQGTTTNAYGFFSMTLPQGQRGAAGELSSATAPTSKEASSIDAE